MISPTSKSKTPLFTHNTWRTAAIGFPMAQMPLLLEGKEGDVEEVLSN